MVPNIYYEVGACIGGYVEYIVTSLCQCESRDVRKPVFGVSDEALHKPGCNVTEDG